MNADRTKAAVYRTIGDAAPELASLPYTYSQAQSQSNGINIFSPPLPALKTPLSDTFHVHFLPWQSLIFFKRGHLSNFRLLRRVDGMGCGFSVLFAPLFSFKEEMALVFAFSFPHL